MYGRADGMPSFQLTVAVRVENASQDVKVFIRITRNDFSSTEWGRD
jgi:hypothetical protein